MSIIHPASLRALVTVLRSVLPAAHWQAAVLAQPHPDLTFTDIPSRATASLRASLMSHIRSPSPTSYNVARAALSGPVAATRP